MSSRICSGLPSGIRPPVWRYREIVQPSNPGVCKRRKIRAPPSTRGSISKSSSHTPQSRRCFGSRVGKRSVGSRRWPSAETTKSFCLTVATSPRWARYPSSSPEHIFADCARGVRRIDQPVGTFQCRPGRPGPSRRVRSKRMTKRWKQRPPGSTWGDWGDDDELGRINLLNPDKVLQGVREVEAGRSFCLSLPLDYPGGTALNQRWQLQVPAPTEDMRGNPATFYNVHMSEMDEGGPRYVDVWADDVVTLSLQYSTQWDSLAHVGAEFDADGDGTEEAVYYNGYRAGVDLVGPAPDAAGDGGNHRCFAHHLGLEHMAHHGVQGRGVLVDLAHHLGHDWRGVDRTTLEEIMAADEVVVEPGDMLLLHTGFATEVLEWNRDPDPVKIHTSCCYLDARDPSLLEWITSSGISALVADNYAVEGLQIG